ncbi:hypothetical protein L6164_034965 [Bauhinia variegata]|uniref:Uncharacterized protein n=1 Tax=Bauhinia variegata TaxID=167791 RepID=A0ACB9KW67_BAUVA|nr:hypothetical protein L6164_034965 [Bauhinia variegata]
MRMEVEKRRSKGSFLNLFDWNGKSRKKLFSDTPNLSEDPRQGKENEENMPKSQHHRIKVDENGASPSIGSCDFNCALSISDEGCGTKAPGLVARLMGLEALPASTVAELSSAALYGTNSLRSYHSHEDTLVPLSDYHPADYINMPHKLGKSSCDAMESRAQKVHNRPIKRFQTETLPPKSAKPIPVTHNKLLSPIKSPGFIPAQNAAHIMEAASRIIEASPRACMKNKMSSVGSSSIPLRILDLKEKLEAAQCASLCRKLVDPSTANPSKDKTSDKSNSIYNCSPALKGSRDSAKSSSHRLGGKGKSVSLATQVKANVDGKDSSTSNGNRDYRKTKEQKQIKSNQFSEYQRPIIQQAMQRRTHTNQKYNVLGQNNQKQNSVSKKGKSTSKDSESNKPATRTRSLESSIGSSKMKSECTLNTNIRAKRSSRRAADSQTESSPSKTKNHSQKKRYTGRDVLIETRVTDNAVNNYEGKSIKCNITTDSMNREAFNMNESKEVISFTFTSPLRRSMVEPQSSAQVMGTKNSIDMDSPVHNDKPYPKKLSLSPPGLHMVDGDALSTLLEKKLQELTSRINSSQCTLAMEGSSAGFRSSLEDKVHTLVGIESREQNRSFHPDLLCDKVDSMYDGDCSSSVDLLVSMNQLEGSEALEEHICSGNSETGNRQGSQHSRAVTIFETPLVNESYLASEDSTYGSTVYSSMQDEEVSNFFPINESVPPEGEVNSYEGSSSTLSEKMTLKQSSGKSNLKHYKKSWNLELEYVKDIISNAELMAEDFVLGQTDEVVMPNLFDLLENRGKVTENYEEFSKLDRKVLFDCLCECLESRCTQTFVGRCKGWLRWVTLVQRKEWLAEDLHAEMLGFKRMEEVMEDELVHKDMSTGYGRWLDFGIEAFEEGLELERDILTCLINELVSDLFLA